MIRLSIGFGTVGLLLLGVACSDDQPTPTPPATAGSAGTATTAGSSSGGSASGSAAGGMAGTGTAGMTTGGAGSSSGGSSGGSSAGAAGTSAGSGGSTAGSGGSGGGSGGSGGSGGGGNCDATTGKALQFKGGVNDLVAGDLGNDLMGGNSARTVELWAHFTAAASWKGEGTVIELGRRTNAANQVFGIDMADGNGRTNADSGKFDPYTNGIGDNDGATAMIPIVTWAHLAWGYDGAGHFEFLVNGTKINLSKPGDGTGMLATTKGIVTLGGSQGFGYEGWDGVMDEVRVWSVYRAEADIKRDMKVKLKGTEAGLVAYYNLDEGTGETADDIKKVAGHQLKFCTANGGACPVQNAAKPMWVASDIPGPFTCAP